MCEERRNLEDELFAVVGFRSRTISSKKLIRAAGMEDKLSAGEVWLSSIVKFVDGS